MLEVGELENYVVYLLILQMKKLGSREIAFATRAFFELKLSSLVVPVIVCVAAYANPFQSSGS